MARLRGTGSLGRQVNPAGAGFAHPPGVRQRCPGWRSPLAQPAYLGASEGRAGAGLGRGLRGGGVRSLSICRSCALVRMRDSAKARISNAPARARRTPWDEKRAIPSYAFMFVLLALPTNPREHDPTTRAAAAVV